jgi:hypothetical protein
MDDQRSGGGAATAIMILLFIAAVTGIAGCITFGIQYPGGNGGAAIGCGIFGAAAIYGFAKVFQARIG